MSDVLTLEQVARWQAVVREHPDDEIWADCVDELAGSHEVLRARCEAAERERDEARQTANGAENNRKWVQGLLDIAEGERDEARARCEQAEGDRRAIERECIQQSECARRLRSDLDKTNSDLTALRDLIGELAAAAGAVDQLWLDCVMTTYPGYDRERASAAMANLRKVHARAKAAARGEASGE